MNERLSDEATRDIEHAVRRICRGIRARRTRREAEREYLEHVEDHVYRLLLRGIPEDKAVAEAIAALGDSEELCHMLCTVHNRLPPELGSNLLWLALRAACAFLVDRQLVGYGLTERFPIVYILPALILFGFTPFRYLRSLILRVRQVARLRRICRQRGYRIEEAASPILSVFFPARRPEWMIEAGESTYCVHFVAVHNRHAVLCLHDSFVYTLTTTHGQGARFIDRAPRRFNSLRTGDQTYENQSFHNLCFPIGADHAGDGVERILLFNPVPSAIRYRRGTAIEYTGNGERVFGCTLYDAKSFAEQLCDHP